MLDAPARHSRASMGLVPVHCERGLLLLEWSVDAASQRALADAQRAIRRVLRALYVRYMRKCESAPQPSWLTLSVEQPRLNPEPSLATFEPSRG